jgi:uncharacterized protein (TIGR03083 family)
MTPPPYSELVTAVRREGEGILTAAGMGLDAVVPTCEGWVVADLVRHLTKVFMSSAGVVASRATQPPERQVLPEDGDPLEMFSTSLDELVSALSDSDADAPIWNWSDGASGVGLFWARRMAHEAAVHRYDAQSAHGVMQPIDSDLAADGIDELFDVLAPRVFSRDERVGPTGTVALKSSDNGEWDLELEPRGLRRVEVLAEPDATVHGTTSTLLLASYRRAPWSSLDVSGDLDLLTRWTSALQF